MMPLNHARSLIRALREAPEPDVVLALAAFVSLLLDGLFNGTGSDLSAGAGALAALTSFPLVVRRRYPLGVFLIAVAGVLACLAVFHPNYAAVGVVMVAVYTVGLQGRRLRSVLVGVAMAPVIAAAVVITSRSSFELAPVVANLALVLVALAAGDARRGRLALIRAAAEEARRQREAAAQHRFDEQRLGVAHELHDTVGHALVAINVQAGAAAHLQRDVPGESLRALEEIKRTSADALAELRSTLKMLRPGHGEAPLRPAQSLADLQDLSYGVGGSGLAVDLRISAASDHLPVSVGHAGYRIIQEALTNVLRHSDAHHAVVSVSDTGGKLTIEVADDGRALPRHPAAPGHGIKGMAERAAALGGHCEAGVAPDGGWRVLAWLPTAIGTR